MENLDGDSGKTGSGTEVEEGFALDKMDGHKEALAEVAADDFFGGADCRQIRFGVPLQDKLKIYGQLAAHVWPIRIWGRVLEVGLEQIEDVFGRHASGLGLRLGLPFCGFGYETLEEGAGGWAFVEGAFGMPLDAEDEAATNAFLCSFDCFDYAVFGAAGGDAEPVAGDSDGLMMAGVHKDSGFKVRGLRFEVHRHDLGEQ